MKRKIKILWALGIVLITFGCIVVPIGVRALASSHRYCREVSAWGALDCSIMLELNEYYREHQRYPDSLKELNLVFEDGAIPEMLNVIQYDFNNTTCTYSYNRHAGKLWDVNTQTHVKITFAEGKQQTYTAITASD